MSTLDTINIWTVANDGTWDTLRAWMDKVNTNFSTINTEKLDKVTDTLDDINEWTTNKHFTATYKTKLDWITAWADMLKSTYDPTNVNGDAFDMDNMAEWATNLILTSEERKHIVEGYSTGLVTRAQMTINANPALFDIPTFTYRVVDGYTTLWTPIYNEYTYAWSTGNTITNLATQDVTYIEIDSAWVIYQSGVLPYWVNQRDRVCIWALVHQSRTQIDYVNEFVNVIGYDVGNQIADLSYFLWWINKWNIFSSNGANLKLNKSAWETCNIGVNWKNSRKSPNITTDDAQTAFFMYQTWRDWAGWWTTYYWDNLVPGKYDDNTAWWTLYPNWNVSTNRYKADRIYFSADLQLVGIEYWQYTYNTIDLAIAWAKADVIDKNPVFAWVTFRGWLIQRWWATTLQSSTDFIFVDAGKFGSESSWWWAGSSTTTLQQAFDNSTLPQILTNSTITKVQLKWWSGVDSDNLLELLNNAWTVKISARADGTPTASTDIVTKTYSDSGTQTLTNKTISATDNSITATSIATWDILKSNWTKFVRMAKWTAYQTLRVNSWATDLEYWNPIQTIAIACSDESTALTTWTAKVTFRMPYAFTLTSVRASLTTAWSTSGTTTVDINEGWTTILSTKLTIDATEKTSTTAATPVVISDTSLADDAEITIDIDAISWWATEAWLKVYLIWYKS